MICILYNYKLNDLLGLKITNKYLNNYDFYLKFNLEINDL